ncbi:MAG: hypothetical protein KKD38_05320 [Candidatus Delongbacteria bacterium]|nr:hypothetical protein [Candidatus Delongbacteria bacterium]MCG2759948.1 hypothetical protein [Candidatus Delongbacteria bacterium]
MKSLIVLILTAFVSLFGGYGLYDIVDDLSWQDSDGGVPVQRSLHNLIDQGKVVFLTWGYNG